MSLGDVAGVFSRYFVVGFFLPSFFTLVGLSQTLTDRFLPTVYLKAGSGARIAIIGGAALLVGLVLLGLSYPIMRLFEGYPLRRHWYTKPLARVLTYGQKRRLRKAIAATVDPRATAVEQRNAVWRLQRTFAGDDIGDDPHPLPTRLGNAIRAFERCSRIRWGLNSIAVWPRIEMLLSADEQQLLSDAKGDVALFVNASLLTALAGLVLIANEVANEPLAFPAALAYLAPFFLSAMAYWGSVVAAIGWGEEVCASIDLHRLELYEKVGLRSPRDFTDERANIAPALNAAMLRGVPLPDDLAAKHDVPPAPASGILPLLRHLLATLRSAL